MKSQTSRPKAGNTLSQWKSSCQAGCPSYGGQEYSSSFFPC